MPTCKLSPAVSGSASSCWSQGFGVLRKPPQGPCRCACNGSCFSLVAFGGREQYFFPAESTTGWWPSLHTNKGRQDESEKDPSVSEAKSAIKPNFPVDMGPGGGEGEIGEFKGHLHGPILFRYGQQPRGWALLTLCDSCYMNGCCGYRPADTWHKVGTR